ncbi:DUF11 domain-containing protein [Microbacterium thalassium]|uniref:DUF11 domain-containing protein n=1 Tax=Microbacterium thalassium TaxID=362649 RepID=A0A7X0KUF3_9MICO|nr:DUF11 domain-containing protein [Microbacterium thalassium]MBB6391053.1 hypothetical protein [Microbacterium thalassium]GLK23836.1 hypothetical protein GCM10017607_11540 [Microbacterium thalassium]
MRSRTRAIAATAAALLIAGACVAASAPPSAVQDAGTAVGASIPAAVGGVRASAEEPPATIVSDGPLTLIEISGDLSCRVRHIDDDLSEFDAETACGTFVATEQALYGPADIPGGGRAQQTPWKPVLQGTGGTGTDEDPYFIWTVVTNDSITVSQIDSYVPGDDFYRTRITVRGGIETTSDVVVYHAGDCRLADSDFGLGSYDPGSGAVRCHPSSESGVVDPDGRVLEFVPESTDGSHFTFASAPVVWARVGSRQALPDSIDQEGETLDHAIALSWDLVAGDESVGVTMLTRITGAPAVVQPPAPLQGSISLSTAEPQVGDEVRVEATVSNPNDSTQVISRLTAELPPGTDYVDGSVEGIGPPTVSGTTLDFGAVTLAGGQSLGFGFSVIPQQEGDGTIRLSGALRTGELVEAQSTFTAQGVVPPPPVIDPLPWALGAIGAALLLILGATTIARIRGPRRQEKLVREHVRLMPQRATTIHHTTTPDVPAPEPPSFRLVGEPGTWEHRVIEEKP